MSPAWREGKRSSNADMVLRVAGSMVVLASVNPCPYHARGASNLQCLSFGNSTDFEGDNGFLVWAILVLACRVPDRGWTAEDPLTDVR